jgi:hypothetical protein
VTIVTLDGRTGGTVEGMELLALTIAGFVALGLLADRFGPSRPKPDVPA